MANNDFLNVGFNNIVMLNRIVSIISPDSASGKRLRDDSRDHNRLIDVTQGRKTRSIVITDSNHIVLSTIQPETLAQRLKHISEGNKNEDPS
jgi:extracellular matrix regulatory protein A